MAFPHHAYFHAVIVLTSVGSWRWGFYSVIAVARGNGLAPGRGLYVLVQCEWDAPSGVVDGFFIAWIPDETRLMG